MSVSTNTPTPFALSLVAGSGHAGTADGIAEEACFQCPAALVFEAKGPNGGPRLLVAEVDGKRIRSIDLNSRNAAVFVQGLV